MIMDDRPRRSLARRARWIVLPFLAALASPAGAQVMDSQLHWLALVDQLELAPNREGTPVVVDATGWAGGDLNRVWIRAEADPETERASGELQAEALYGRLISPYWDALAGVRVDHRWGGGSATRAQLALGVEGLAPYWFELAPTLYVSHDGDVSAELEAEYELLLTQRTILQPRLEVHLAVQDVPQFGVGSGLSDLELGARVRYELRRELAPYVGVAWHQAFGDTADLARDAGEDVSNVSFVGGVRVWY
ncbi:copper resistance protein B [Anaeromyxobacter sp. Fw109-5]|uniref:copper resistance protein B n=1 Tax=Anaeromyxobacter sp. (strain Fw109-5) TaxID=404589 RepID=UPI0000ED6CC7|nr:copper resistance protein B [Anaeromyxobacter sp. Fw109-5]ABS28444.1 copper resistance B precursor [Anaeromyxobacter sp. Fw109-5]